LAAGGLGIGDPRTSTVRFGTFEANFRSGELRRNGIRVRLQEQPLQVLNLLLEKPGEVVTREELQARLWPADTFVDFDHSLNTAIKRLRDALGDSAENPHFVETLARRGYRFIAPVNNGSAAACLPVTATPGVSALKNPLLWAIFLALLLVGLSAGWLVGRRTSAKAGPHLEERRVTANPAELPIHSAALSRDGNYVAYSDANGLFLHVLETGETRPISLPAGLHSRAIGWFPDGTHILAAARDPQTAKPGLWSISVLGAEPRKIVDDADHGALSPDGQQLAFVRGEEGQQAIWLARSNGADQRVLPDTKAADIAGLAWSPDARWLALVRGNARPGHYSLDLAVVDFELATGISNVLLSDSTLGPGLTWSAQDKLQFARADLPPAQNDTNLWELPLNPRSALPTGPPLRLTSGPDRKSPTSASRDGKRILYGRGGNDPDVYLADIEGPAARLTHYRRLTLDDRKDLPYGWTADSRSVLFISNRDGAFHVFRQGTDRTTAELVVGGENSVMIARMNPEQNAVMYLLSADSAYKTPPYRLMEQPLAGGEPRKILQGGSISNFQCAFLPSRLCLVSDTPSPSTLIIYQFNEQTGEKKEIMRVQENESSYFNWTLSRDGKRLATARISGGRGPTIIHIRELATGRDLDLPLPAGVGVQYIDWAADSTSLWVSMAAGDRQSLARMALNGKFTSSFDSKQPDLGWGVPSPDGKHLAILQGSPRANAWLITR
jgi:DNA-binding winged helix-turn-helix (wHTH) protein/Tol biopolymer transport system component